MTDFTEIHPSYRIPDEVWQRISLAIPPDPPKPTGERSRMDNRKALDAIFYVLRTGCQWKAEPSKLRGILSTRQKFQNVQELIDKQFWVQ